MAIKEYEFIYHESYYDELADIGIPINRETQQLIKEYSKELIQKRNLLPLRSSVFEHGNACKYVVIFEGFFIV